MNARRPPESWVRNAVFSSLDHIAGSIDPVENLGVEIVLPDGKRMDLVIGSLEHEDGGFEVLKLTVVEFKKSVADVAALIQLMQYMGRLKALLMGTEIMGRARVHGVLLAPDFSEELVEAMTATAASGDWHIHLLQLRDNLKFSDPSELRLWEISGEVADAPQRADFMAIIQDRYAGKIEEWRNASNA